MTILVFSVLTAFVAAGCATARPRRPQTTPEPIAPPPTAQQMTDLQTQVQAKDQQIQDLQYQLEQSRHTPESNYTSGNVSSATASKGGGKSSKIHVSGVSVMDVQNALAKAGFDPGSADGKMGKKTKSAIKAFQRAHKLTADGIIGEKTWKLLQS